MVNRCLTFAFSGLQRLSNLRIHDNFNSNLCQQVAKTCVRVGAIDSGTSIYFILFFCRSYVCFRFYEDLTEHAIKYFFCSFTQDQRLLMQLFVVAGKKALWKHNVHGLTPSVASAHHLLVLHVYNFDCNISSVHMDS